MILINLSHDHILYIITFFDKLYMKTVRLCTRTLTTLTHYAARPLSLGDIIGM